MVVQEGEERAQVLCVRALGEQGRIWLGLALDFSGSMAADSVQEGTNSIDVSPLPQGTYIVHVASHAGEKLAQRLVGAR